MSEMAMKDPSTATNPVSLNKNDFFKLYQDSYRGDLKNSVN